MRKPPRKIVSRMSIFGHPIHPMLVHFPTAALVGLVGTDITYILTGDYFWARAGLVLAAVGAIGGWLAGIVGLADIVVTAAVRRLITAWCHGVLAVMLLSLASLNWLLRYGDPAALIMPWGLYVSLLSGGLIVLTAALGGQLVYEHAVGVNARKE